MPDPNDSFALFVSCVDGQPVTRYGTGTMIGASRSKLAPTVVVYDPALVVGIPHDEYRKHQRSYDRAIRNGSLAERSPNDYRAQERAERVKAAAAPQAVSLELNELTDRAAGDPPA